jgi:P pilus assembly chaperone PapD
MRPILSCFIAGLLTLATIQDSAADLIVTPTRIILDDRTPGAEFRAVNTSQEPRAYRVAWRELRMAANGQLVERSGDTAHGAASALVRVSPAQIRLRNA